MGKARGSCYMGVIYRKVKISDAEAIHSLVNRYAGQGLMLPRSRNFIYENLREFTAAEINGKFLGVAGLHIVWENLAEIRALAVQDENVGSGIGKGLVERLQSEALELGIPRLFALTYKPEFFEKCGFRRVDKEELPHKVWKECINCPQFPNCDEVALVKDI